MPTHWSPEPISIPAERALTVYVDKRELVTLMTLGANPELLVLGTMRTRSATRIIMNYSGAQRLSVSGSELPEGQPTPILTDASLVLPGLGHLTIHPGESTDTAILQKAEADFARDRTRLKLTLRAKRLGLSLVEAKEIIDSYDSPRDTAPQLRKFLAVLTEHRKKDRKSVV